MTDSHYHAPLPTNLPAFNPYRPLALELLHPLDFSFAIVSINKYYTNTDRRKKMLMPTFTLYTYNTILLLAAMCDSLEL